MQPQGHPVGSGDPAFGIFVLLGNFVSYAASFQLRPRCCFCKHSCLFMEQGSLNLCEILGPYAPQRGAFPTRGQQNRCLSSLTEAGAGRRPELSATQAGTGAELQLELSVQGLAGGEAGRRQTLMKQHGFSHPPQGHTCTWEHAASCLRSPGAQGTWGRLLRKCKNTALGSELFPTSASG